MHINYDDASPDEIEEELAEPVVIERDDLEELQSDAETSDEIQAELSSLREEVDGLADAREIVEKLDEEALALITGEDEHTVVEVDDYEEMSSTVQDVGHIYADELADHTPASMPRN